MTDYELCVLGLVRRASGHGGRRRMIINDLWGQSNLVGTIEYRAAAAEDSIDAEGWLAEFDTGFARIAGRFGRVEPRRQAWSFLLGLLSDVETRSC